MKILISTIINLVLLKNLPYNDKHKKYLSVSINHYENNSLRNNQNVCYLELFNISDSSTISRQKISFDDVEFSNSTLENISNNSTILKYAKNHLSSYIKSFSLDITSSALNFVSNLQDELKNKSNKYPQSSALRIFIGFHYLIIVNSILIFLLILFNFLYII